MLGYHPCQKASSVCLLAKPDTNPVNDCRCSCMVLRQSLQHHTLTKQSPVADFYYQQATSVGYYRGGRKGKEIDIVVDKPNTYNILIEVKYREGAPIKDDDAIAELRAEASAAIVVTKGASDFGVHNTKSGRDMLRIPAFAFLYLLGHAEKNGYKGID